MPLPARMSVSCWTSAPLIDGLALLVLLAQPVDQLRAQDVDLAVQDAPPVGDLLLLLGELLDQVLQLLVGEGSEIRECVHGDPFGESGASEYSRCSSRG